MKLLNTVYVSEHRYRVAVSRDALEIRNGRHLQARYPLNAVDSIVLLGSSTVTSPALARCAAKGIRVSALDRGGRLKFVVSGAVSGNVLLRRAQYVQSADDAAADQLSRMFVAGKVANSARMVRRWQRSAEGISARAIAGIAESLGERLAKLSKPVAGDTIRGIEGDAARLYFKALRMHLDRCGTALAFGTRSRRPPRDEINACLSFGYGLLLTRVVGALDAVGLDPQVGFLHKVRPGRPALALDAMEEMRVCIVDRFVVGLAARRVMRPEHFWRTSGGAVYMTDQGRAGFVQAWERFMSEELTHPVVRQGVPRAIIPSIQSTLLARVLRGDLDVYPPYVMEH